MSDYTRVYNFTVKDSLPTGDSGKVIKGTEIDVELNAVAAAIASKADTNSPTFTGTPLAPTASYGTSTTQLATTAFVQAALQALYPVGSIYINASSTTNPSSLFGFGTWVAFGEGKVLVGQNTSDTSFDTLEETGGSKDAITVSHTHTFSATSGNSTTGISTVSGGAHTHTYSRTYAGSGSKFTDHSGQDEWEGWVTENTGSSGAHTHTITDTGHTHSVSGTTGSTGSSGTNANLQPYVVVKMWKRTA